MARPAKWARVVAQIGVDEKAAAKGHSYRTLVCDLQEGTVEHIADDRKQAGLDRYSTSRSEAQRKRIEAEARDMGEPSISIMWNERASAIHRYYQDHAKRIFDILFSSIGLVCFAPLFLVIAVSIKLDSPGPVFYRGTRIGEGGRPFRIYKFRTMVEDAEKLGGTSTAENDRRIMRAGHLLRRYKIDELPQLINVLKGEMSLVGPRPEVEEYTRLYSEKDMIILSVKPGITDYASIRFRHLNAILAMSEDPDQYYRDDIRPEKNRLRLEYALHHTFWGDIKIIFATLKAIFVKTDGI